MGSDPRRLNPISLRVLRWCGIFSILACSVVGNPAINFPQGTTKVLNECL
jgi:hypothetical protein